MLEGPPCEFSSQTRVARAVKYLLHPRPEPLRKSVLAPSHKLADELVGGFCAEKDRVDVVKAHAAPRASAMAARMR